MAPRKKPAVVDEAMIKQMVALHQKGMSVSKIGEHFGGISSQTVRKHLNNAGCKTNQKFRRTESIARVKKMHEAGLKLHEIAAQMEPTTLEVVKSYLNEAGIPWGMAARKERAIALHHEGLANDIIAKKLKCHEASVARYLKEVGLSGAYINAPIASVRREQRKAQVEKLYREGVSLYDIADQVGCNYDTVCLDLGKCGIIVRDDKKQKRQSLYLGLFEVGIHPKEIARSLNVNYGYVCEVISATGVNLQNPEKKIIKARNSLAERFQFSTWDELCAYFEGDKITCLLCGRSFSALGNHLRQVHQMDKREYNRKYGIPHGRGLTSSDCHEVMVESGKERVVKRRAKDEQAWKDFVQENIARLKDIRRGGAGRILVPAEKDRLVKILAKGRETMQKNKRQKKMKQILAAIEQDGDQGRSSKMVTRDAWMPTSRSLDRKRNRLIMTDTWIIGDGAETRHEIDQRERIVSMTDILIPESLKPRVDLSHPARLDNLFFNLGLTVNGFFNRCAEDVTRAVLQPLIEATPDGRVLIADVLMDFQNLSTDNILDRNGQALPGREVETILFVVKKALADAPPKAWNTDDGMFSIDARTQEWVPSRFANQLHIEDEAHLLPGHQTWRQNLHNLYQAWRKR